VKPFIACSGIQTSAMYREQVPSYKHLDEPLDEGRFVFECILAGNLQF